MISNTLVETFLWVADLKSFRGAAERLNTTQPNISTRVATLEQIVGSELFVRGKGTLRLTAAGERLLPEARKLVGAATQFHLATDLAQHITSSLRLGVTEMVAHSWLPRFVRVFRQAFPQVSLTLSVDISSRLSAALNEHQLDLCFQTGPFEDDELITLPLGAQSFRWVAARAGPESLEKGLTLAVSSPTSEPHRELTKHLRKLQREDISLIGTTNLAALLGMIEENLAVGLLPEALVSRALEGGRLKVIDLDWLPTPLSIAARHLPERTSPLLSQVLKLAEAARLEVDLEVDQES